MTCGTCLSDKARAVSVRYREGKWHDFCDVCSDVRVQGLPDVFLGSNGGIQTDDNIRDPKSGEMIPFSTKREKLAAMKRAGVRQAPSAEREHGHRNESHLNRKTYFI
jgi:hypothetical protein